jgi:serine/threonine protein kinase
LDSRLTDGKVDHIAHYQIPRKLGEGGMGVVYLAEDERLRRRVALKVLRDGSADPVARRGSCAKRRLRPECPTLSSARCSSLASGTGIRSS